MLGVLCARHKPPIFTSFSLLIHAPPAVVHHRDTRLHGRGSYNRVHLAYAGTGDTRRQHTSSCNLSASTTIGGAASIWHAILPSACSQGGRLWRNVDERRGEGSWNVTCDARPARWLHRLDSGWLLFGVCACLAPIVDFVELESEVPSGKCKVRSSDLNLTTEVAVDADENKIATPSSDYKVTGVLADGRCLFRALAHAARMRSGEEAPDENRQRELADELRAKVVNELSKRREETEWFIEGDFDAYVKEIQQPYVWGGEPELLMASHVLKAPISVYMIHRISGNLMNIAYYGNEYQKNGETPINVLFHGYGHYDILESLPAQQSKELDT